MGYHLIGNVPASALDATFCLGSGMLPHGTPIALIKGLDGRAGDGFVVADIAALVELTGNPHDPHYRYVRVPERFIFGDSEEEWAQLDRIAANWSSVYPLKES